jgi:two-component system, OmpR family, sensor kinase
VARAPGGLRLRLTLAICAVSLGVVACSFFVLREETGAHLRDRIDRELRDQLAEFGAAVPARARLSPRATTRLARKFVESQDYHASSRIFAISLRGQPLVTNQPKVLERESAREHPSETSAGGETAEELGESGLLDAPDGLADAAGEETGDLRVLSAPIRGPGQRLGTFRVADPLRPVEDAQSGLNRAVVLVGLLALVASVAIALAIATLMTRRLRAMARVASAVGEEDLKARIGGRHQRDEIGVLADAFDRMLDRLERAFARQREFVSDASHELRTPLTVLRGQVELLDDETDPSQRHRAVATVLRELDGMNRLVEEMLTLAASESPDLVRPQQIELAGFVEDLRRDLPLLGERNYSVSGTSAGTLKADPDRLHQVLRNLVRNAVAATGPADPITVTLSARGDALEFSVSDTGPGIPSGELERVFDRFHRVDTARDRSHGGTGLGLAIAQALVQAHGGWIRAESPSSGGTTIRFSLPGYDGA